MIEMITHRVDHPRPTERSVGEHLRMTLTFSGARTHEPDTLCVEYTVFLDGEEIECTIDDAVVASLCDESPDPLQTFDSCHMLILEYTRQKLCGVTTGICARIGLRGQSCSFYTGPRGNSKGFVPIGIQDGFGVFQK